MTVLYVYVRFVSRFLRRWILVGTCSLLLFRCTEAPVAPSTPSASATTTTTALTGAGDFRVDLPVAASDVGDAAFGLVPFGVHLADHGLDGHPGWDVEYRVGASVLAAAAGTVQSAVADGFTAGYTTVQLSHQAGGKSYRTVYTNVGTLAPGIAPGATVTAGQPLGIAAIGAGVGAVHEDLRHVTSPPAARPAARPGSRRRGCARR